jgi:hypothetical protein
VSSPSGVMSAISLSVEPTKWGAQAERWCSRLRAHTHPRDAQPQSSSDSRIDRPTPTDPHRRRSLVAARSPPPGGRPIGDYDVDATEGPAQFVQIFHDAFCLSSR